AHAESTHPFGVGWHIPPPVAPVVAVRARAEGGVGDVAPVGAVVAGSFTGSRAVRDLGVLQAGCGRRGMCREAIALAPLRRRLRGVADPPAFASPPQRRPRSARATIGREVRRLEREGRREVAGPGAL